MYNIVLVSTSHRKSGKCNSDELHRIIQSICPEVIFEELNRDLFDKFYNKNQTPNESPEVNAVKRYLQLNNVINVPVDIDVNPNLSNEEIEYMFGMFGRYEVYRRLDEELSVMTEQKGFSFLNSERCLDIFEQKRARENELIGFMGLNKAQVLRIHQLFYQEQNEREYEIINNIYRYSDKNPFNQALFLIGAAHRASIIKKIEKFKLHGNARLNWRFYSTK